MQGKIEREPGKVCIRVESKPRDLGNDRGYRVANRSGLGELGRGVLRRYMIRPVGASEVTAYENPHPLKSEGAAPRSELAARVKS
jgi:hypothetical protein